VLVQEVGQIGAWTDEEEVVYIPLRHEFRELLKEAELVALKVERAKRDEPVTFDRKAQIPKLEEMFEGRSNRSRAVSLFYLDQQRWPVASQRFAGAAKKLLFVPFDVTLYESDRTRLIPKGEVKGCGPNMLDDHGCTRADRSRSQCPHPVGHALAEPGNAQLSRPFTVRQCNAVESRGCTATGQALQPRHILSFGLKQVHVPMGSDQACHSVRKQAATSARIHHSVTGADEPLHKLEGEIASRTCSPPGQAGVPRRAYLSDPVDQSANDVQAGQPYLSASESP
jgi:hypothetical protein